MSGPDAQGSEGREHRPPVAAELRAAGRSLLTAAAFVIVVAGMREASIIVTPFLLALFVAVVTAPLFQGLQRRGVPSALAIVLVVLLLGGLIALVVVVVERAVSGFADNLPGYREAFLAQIAAAREWLATRGLDLPPDPFEGLLDLQLIGPVAGTLRDLAVTVFIVVIVTIFILLEATALPEKVRTLPGLSQESWERIHQIVADVRRYMLLKTVMSLLTGALVAAWLLLLGIDFPIVLGVLAFALNYIPNIGSIVAAVPGILLAFVELGLGSALIATLGYVVINVGVSNGIEPRYLGHGLGLSPLVVLSSVIFWGWVLGPLGMLLAVPLTMTAKISLESDENTRWIALLMSGRPRQPRRRALRPRLGAAPGTRPE